ncbi:MAG: PAS domain-containing sensor histidine kinase [Deltaproteobacteria bacterium]|nr:PAS domain-containing sensor histidine kinase [Deltaproteobacteria bacterium]
MEETHVGQPRRSTGEEDAVQAVQTNSLRFLAFLGVGVLLGESLIMVILGRLLPPYSLVVETLVDATALACLLVPAGYWFFHRPMVRNLAVLQRTKQALAEKETWYRLLVETMNDGLCVVDAQGAISYVNERFARMFGGQGQGLIGLRVDELLTGPGQRILRDQLERRRRGEEAPYEVSWIGEGGVPVHALVAPKVIHGPDGTFGGSFAVVTDVTDLKRTHEQLNQWKHYLQQLSARLLSAQEQERAKLARELHDGLGQTLTAVKFLIESACAERWAADEAAVPEALSLAILKLKEAGAEVRRIGAGLRPGMLDDLGVVAALSWHCRQFEATYPHLKLERELSLEESEVPDALKIVIFRVCQEALNNAAKHSRADRIRIALAGGEGGVHLSVEDDGVGFDVAEALALKTLERGFGLDSMRERTLYSGGSFWIDSGAGKGTSVHASWPTERPEATG